MERFGDGIPSEVTFILKNGTKILGNYDKVSKVFIGLHEVFRSTCLSVLDTLLFTYYGDGVFHISAFAGDCVEKPVENISLPIGTKFVSLIFV